MSFLHRLSTLLFICAVLLIAKETLAQNDNDDAHSEAPSIIGSWRVETERTSRSNAEAQKGMSPEKLASINSLTFELTEKGTFDQSMGENYHVTGSWKFEASDLGSSKAPKGSKGRLTFSVENVDNHADMFLDVSFLTPDLLEAKNVLFPAPIYLERVYTGAKRTENRQKNEQDEQDERRDRAAEAFANVPGCLGAKSMEQDGTQVSFVWFKDREAVINWCKDQKHMRTAETILNLANPDLKMREPMAAAKNEEGPFLVIMTLKRNENGGAGGFPLEQLSMEIYKPVNGGMFIGDRFAPKELNVDGMREIRTK